MNSKTLRRITALKVQKKNKERVNVYLDGEFAFGLSRIVAAWLQVDQELDDQKIADLQYQDKIDKAYNKAWNFISYRPRSEAEVKTKLRKSDIPDEIIHVVLEKLIDKEVIDDRRFAKMWIDNRTEFRPRGRQALRVELRQKDIKDEIIDDLLANLDEESLAYRVASQKGAKLRGQEWLAFSRRMTAFLARRGFDYDVIRTTVERVWNEF